MTSYQKPVPSLKSFKGDTEENCKEFEESWDHYIIAAHLHSKLKDTAGRKIVAATLFTIMGAECNKIMNSLPILSKENKKNLNKILWKHNVLYE